MLNVWIPQLTRGDINIRTLTCIGATAFGFAFTATTAFAEDFTTLTVEDRFDLEREVIVALYDSLRDKLAAGYTKKVMQSARISVHGPHQPRTRRFKDHTRHASSTPSPTISQLSNI
jgi:hypothetical protein